MMWVESWQAVGDVWPAFPMVLGGALGGVAGSFISCAVGRVREGVSLRFPPSQCDACERRLVVVDLIPVISWLLTAGTCRTCKARIGLWVWAVEVISVMVGVGLARYVVWGVWFMPHMIGLLAVYAALMVGLGVRIGAYFPQMFR